MFLLITIKKHNKNKWKLNIFVQIVVINKKE